MSNGDHYDWPFLDDSHREIAASIKKWAADVLPSFEHESEENPDATAKKLVDKLAGAGWLQYLVPASSGGVSEKLDTRAICLIREHLAYYSGLADFAFIMQGLGSGPITLFGNDKLKQEFLPAVIKGQNIAAFALTEPDAGSDVSAISTIASKQGEHYILNGEKTLISNGGIADFYVVFARTGEGEGTKGLSAFLVAADTPGLNTDERIQIIAPHPMGRLKFTDCKIPKDNLIGQPGEGFTIAMTTLDHFRPTVGAAALGMARRAFDEAVRHVKSRKMFGGRLADLQMTEAAIADMALDIDASAALVYRAAWARDTGRDSTKREASMAKLFATEAAQRVIDRAVQLFGGQGVVTGEPVETLYREVRALRIYEGASEIHKIIIAREYLKTP